MELFRNVAQGIHQGEFLFAWSENLPSTWRMVHRLVQWLGRRQDFGHAFANILAQERNEVLHVERSWLDVFEACSLHLLKDRSCIGSRTSAPTENHDEGVCGRGVHG